MAGETPKYNPIFDLRGNPPFAILPPLPGAANELARAVAALPKESREAPGIPVVLDQVQHLAEELDAFRRATEVAAGEERRSGRRLFWWGALLSVPVGIIGSFIAHLVGIG
jgi:hypothetical protein